MEEFGDSIADVFAGTETIIHLRKDAPIDEKAVKAALAKHEVKLKGLKKNRDYLL